MSSNAAWALMWLVIDVVVLWVLLGALIDSRRKRHGPIDLDRFDLDLFRPREGLVAADDLYLSDPRYLVN